MDWRELGELGSTENGSLVAQKGLRRSLQYIFTQDKPNFKVLVNNQNY